MIATISESVLPEYIATIERLWVQRTDVYNSRPRSCACIKEPLTASVIRAHLLGEDEIYSYATPEKAEFAGFDLDGKNTEGGVEQSWEWAKAIHDRFVDLELPAPLIEVSNGGKGFHHRFRCDGSFSIAALHRFAVETILKAGDLPHDQDEAAGHPAVYPKDAGKKGFAKALYWPWMGLATGKRRQDNGAPVPQEAGLFVDPETREPYPDQLAAVREWLKAAPISSADLARLGVDPSAPPEEQPRERPKEIAAPRLRGADDGTPYGLAACARECDDLAASPDHSRHPTLFPAAAALGELIAGGELRRDYAEGELFAACVANGMIAEGREDEVHRTIADGIEQGLTNPRTAPREPRSGQGGNGVGSPTDEPPPLGEFTKRPNAAQTVSGVVEDHSDPEEAEVVPELPEQCWRHGFEQFRAAVAHTSEATDAYYFAAYLTAAGSQFHGIWHHMGMRVYPNIFACSVGKTGRSRKSTGQSWCRELLADDGDTLLPGVGSPEGLLKACEENPVRVLTVVELATLLAKGAQDGSRGLIPLLTSMYDANTPVGNRTAKDSVRIDEHHLSVIASTTPEWLCENMTKSAIMGGFGGRWMYFTGPESPPMPETPEPDEHMLRVAKEIIRNAVAHQPGKVTKTSEAQAVWAEFYCREHGRPVEDPISDALRQRLHSNAIKLALVYCGLEGTAHMTAPQITAAVAFADHQRGAIEHVYQDYRDGEKVDWTAAEAALIRWVKKQLAQGVKPSKTLANEKWRNSRRANRTAHVLNRIWRDLSDGTFEFDADGVCVVKVNG